MDAQVVDEIRTLMLSGRKIEAIKVYREATGAGLRDAKDAVEAIADGDHIPVPETESHDELIDEVIGFLDRGETILAIKRVRELTGAGLADAKRRVDRIAADHGYQVPAGTGCGQSFVVLVLGAIIGAGFALVVWLMR